MISNKELAFGQVHSFNEPLFEIRDCKDPVYSIHVHPEDFDEKVRMNREKSYLFIEVDLTDVHQPLAI